MKMIRHHTLKVSKTAHYFTIGEPGPSISRLVLACHGYGQLARYFIRRFDVLDNGITLVVAPEGLSRFYTEGLTGKVGASWMTKEDRLREIDDYADYLQDLLESLLMQVSSDVEITLFGFSQGCATVMRWAMKKFPRVDRFVLYGGLLPEDLDYRPYRDYFNTRGMWWVYGNADEFLTKERVDWHHSFMGEQGLTMKTRVFDGGHELSREVLRDIFV